MSELFDRMTWDYFHGRSISGCPSGTVSFFTHRRSCHEDEALVVVEEVEGGLGHLADGGLPLLPRQLHPVHLVGHVARREQACREGQLFSGGVHRWSLERLVRVDNFPSVWFGRVPVISDIEGCPRFPTRLWYNIQMPQRSHDGWDFFFLSARGILGQEFGDVR